MQDYKKLWDELYNYLDNWFSISLKYNENNIYKTVGSVERAYAISAIMDKMMDLEADAERGEK